MSTYNEAVTEARHLVTRSEEDQWRLAELTWEQVEAGKSRRQWATDIGVSSQHADALYKVWARFGAHDHGHSFAQSYEMTLRKADSPEQAASIRDEQRALPTIRNMPPERKAEVARELLQDPQVAREVVEDSGAREAVEHATDQRAGEMLGRKTPRERTTSGSPLLTLKLTGLLSRAKDVLRLAINESADLDMDQVDDAIAQDLREQITAIKNLTVLLENGWADRPTDTDWDAELAKIT